MSVEHSFFLGDMLHNLCAEGGCELAIITRCSVAWGKKPITQYYHPSMFR